MSIKFQRLEIFSSDIRLQESKSTRHPPSSGKCKLCLVHSLAPGCSGLSCCPHLASALLPGNQRQTMSRIQWCINQDISDQESKDLNSRSYYRRIIYFILFLWICDVLAIKIIYKWMSLLYVVIFSDSPFLTLNDFS